jgi:hypothetical protein
MAEETITNCIDIMVSSGDKGSLPASRHLIVQGLL